MFIAIWNSFLFLLIVFIMFTTCAIPLRPVYKHHLILFTSFIFHIFSLIKAIVSRKASADVFGSGWLSFTRFCFIANAFIQSCQEHFYKHKSDLQ